ncbi:hypothetical protein M1D97_10410 [Kushneria sp. AK178]
MAETNERLARVEERVEHIAQAQGRQDQHLEAIRDSFNEVSSAVSQQSNLMQQMVDMQKQGAQHGQRLAILEQEQERQRETIARHHELTHDIRRNGFRINLVWTVLGVIAAALLTAWLRGDL